jgi:uncharacterized membrane protein
METTMKFHSRMRHRSRWFLVATAVLVVCLPVNFVQLAPGPASDLVIAQLSEAGRVSPGSNDTMLIPISLPAASWQGLFAAGRW